MQQLHLVGFTTDLEGLIFSVRKGSKSGGFVVPIDAALLATIEDARRMRDGDTGSSGSSRSRGGSGSGAGADDRRPRPESTLSPREIQARLRAGSSIVEVADAAGVDEDWVLRFAVPILAEQQQVVDRARSLVMAKARRGDSAQALGTSVLWNLADRGLRMTEAAWDAAWRAWNLHGAVWVVQFAYTSRQRSQNAEWEVDLREGALHARNRLAADLGYIEPGRRRRGHSLFEPPEEAAAPQAAPKPASKAAKKAAKSAKRTQPAGRAGATSTAARATRPAARAAGSTGGNTAKARGTGKAAKPAKATKATKAAKAAKATKAKAAGKTAAARSGRPTRPPARPGDERVSHLARPAQPPERRGAARDGTPSEPMARRPVVGSPAGGLPPTTRRPPEPPRVRPAPPPVPTQAPAPVSRPPRPMPTAERPAPPPQARPRPDEPVVRPRPGPPPSGASERARPRPEPEPERPRIERQRGRPEAPPEPVDERARRRPVVPPPSGQTEDGTVVIRRPEGAGNGARPSADPPAEDRVWHGPGSGDPAPPVRIRADLAATAQSNADGARRTRRSAGRERPLRAR